MKNEDNKKEESEMAVLTYPTRAPIVLKEGRLQSFLEKCKKNAISEEQKQAFIRCSDKAQREGENK